MEDGVYETTGYYRPADQTMGKSNRTGTKYVCNKHKRTFYTAFFTHRAITAASRSRSAT